MLIDDIGELPVLQDGATYIGGYENIIHYLRKKSNGQWDLDRHLSNSKDRADVTAYFLRLLIVRGFTAESHVS